MLKALHPRLLQACAANEINIMRCLTWLAAGGPVWRPGGGCRAAQAGQKCAHDGAGATQAAAGGAQPAHQHAAQLQTRTSQLPAAVLVGNVQQSPACLQADHPVEACQGLLGLLPGLRLGPHCPGAVCRAPVFLQACILQTFEPHVLLRQFWAPHPLQQGHVAQSCWLAGELPCCCRCRRQRWPGCRVAWTPQSSASSR